MVSLYIFGSVLLVSAISLLGISLFLLKDKWMHEVLTFLISFAAGALMGDVFIHILPEMAEESPEFFPTASLFIIGGIMLSFVLEKFIHWRHCHHEDYAMHPVGTMSLVGDAAHNFIDGLIIASSYLVDINAGIATTVAVILHEIPQEFGDIGVLLYSGYSKTRAILMNLLTALASVVGAALVLGLRGSLPDIEQYLFPFVAGNFLYIAVGDLLPELHKHTKPLHSFFQVLALVAGICLMFTLTFLE